MFTICWSPKGGSGTTTIACALGLGAVHTQSRVVIVDFAGDVLSVLGVASPSSAGVADWFASDAPRRALDGLLIDSAAGLEVLPAGDRASLAALASRTDRLADFVSWLLETDASVFIDAGTNLEIVRALSLLLNPHRVASVLVLRNCFLAVERAMSSPTSTHVVLVRELSRSLQPRDIETALGRTLDADVLCDPSVARAVDAGLSSVRVPRALARAVRPLVASLTHLREPARR